MKDALFEFDDYEEKDEKYSYKVKAPIYKPRGIKPHPLELYETGKADRLCDEIKKSNLSKEEKQFLMYAAQRHVIFNYSKIADYYANASKEMQILMEDSALVIIDFNKAIEKGFVKLADDIAELYAESYDE